MLTTAVMVVVPLGAMDAHSWAYRGQEGAAGSWSTVVEASVSSSTANDTLARRKAESAARTQAVRKAVHHFVGAVSSGRIDQVVGDSESFTDLGHALGERSDGGRLTMTVEVKVYTTSAPKGKRALLPVLGAEGLLRPLSATVLVTERHLRPAPIPDPAVETELTRRLIESGIRVVDRRVLRRALASNPELQDARTSVQKARKLAAWLKSDVVIVGEAFSQVSSQHEVRDDALGTTYRIWSCSARAEVKVVWVDTAEVLAAAAVHASGADMSEELAAKKALQNAGARIHSELIDLLWEAALDYSRRHKQQVPGKPTGVHP